MSGPSHAVAAAIDLPRGILELLQIDPTTPASLLPMLAQAQEGLGRIAAEARRFQALAPPPEPMRPAGALASPRPPVHTPLG